jgi:HSP20 family protein
MLLSTRRFAAPSVDPFTSMRREMDQLFGRFLNDRSGDGGVTRGWYAPVAMWDDNEKVYVEVELPGISKDDVDLTVQNGMLRISGERKQPEGERSYWLNDRSYGAFDRTISLPDDVDADNIDAQLSDGVLHIVLAKKPEAQPKKITVRT